MASTDWAPPHVDELAALMFARVKGEFGQAETFTAQSRPTLEQATTKLAQAFSMVAVRTGFTLDDRFHGAAQLLTILYGALLLEPGYWPEDQQGDASAWEEWKLLYDEGMLALLKAIEEGAGGDEDDVGPDDNLIAPVWWFGPRCIPRAPGSEFPRDPCDPCRRVW